MQMTTTYFNNLSLARQMILRGYINYVISIEASLPQTTIQDMRRTMVAEGVAQRIRDRSIRRSQTIIKRRAHAEDASLLMLAYRRLLGAEASERSIHLAALEEAYDTYTLIRQEIDPHAEISLTINDAYSLARDLRRADAYFPECRVCSAQYFVAVAQECMARCPWCHTPEGEIGPLPVANQRGNKTSA